jgi:hypothetical protein
MKLVRAGDLVRGLTFSLVVAYLAFALVSALPVTPLRTELAEAVGANLFRIFGQRWSMFAPPQSRVPDLMAKCRAPDGSSRNVHLLEQLRFTSSADTTGARIRLAGTLLDILQREQALRSKERDPSSDSDLERRRRNLNEHWRRIGSIACADAYPDVAFESVSLSWAHFAEHAWSRRFDKDAGSSELREVGTFPVMAGVVRPGLFKPGVDAP